MIDVNFLWDGTKNIEKRNNEGIKFKNRAVKKEVDKIQKQGRIEVSGLKTKGRKIIN